VHFNPSRAEHGYNYLAKSDLKMVKTIKNQKNSDKGLKNVEK